MNFKETVRTLQPDSIKPLGDGRFGARVALYRNGWRAVIKTTDTQDAEGRRTFRNIPLKTVPQREVAFYVLARILGWDSIVPQTVLTRVGGKLASAQVFIPSVYIRDLDAEIFNYDNPDRILHLKAAAKQFPKDEWRKLVLLDLIANNRDRHGKNIVVTFPGPHLWAIDNSAAFGLSFAKYRNIFHKYLFRRSFNLLPYLERLKEVKRGDLKPLELLLDKSEVDAVFARIQFIIRRPYMVPWMAISQNDTKPFPAYRDWFKRGLKLIPENKL